MWRRVWLQLGANGFENADAATKWVEQVVPMIGDDHAGRVALAETWNAIGARLSSQAAFANAKAIIDPMTANAQTAADGWRLSAMLGESSGDMPRVITAYRKLLESHPDEADLRNNLAYALLVQGKSDDLAEAKTLIEAAIAKFPANGTYLDTLARIRLSSGDLAGAGEAFKQALAAEQNNLDAMIGLADVHARTGQTNEARNLLARINDALPADAKLADPLQRQLESVRAAVKGQLPSGRAE